MQNKFYSGIAGFTLAILVSSFIKMGFSFFLFLLILSAFTFIFAYLRRQGKYFAMEKNGIILITIFIFFFAFGVLRYEIKEIKDEQNNLSSFVDQKVILQGVVVDEPAIKDGSVQIIVSADSIISADHEINSTTKILISTGLFPEFKYGDLIRAEGKLTKPEDFLTDNGNNFDYINYLGKEDIFYQISFAQAKSISSGHGSFLKTKLFQIKNSFMSKINLAIKEPESSLLSGLLLGAKNSLGKELQTDFRVAGVSHIVALSGYNITIVAEGIMAMLLFLPKIFSFSFGVLGILAFAIMTGGTATVMRASIMALLVLLARGTNRRYDITRALLLAGVFMLIQNPKILVFDISFQLSFMATISLILVVPIIEKKVTFITEKYKLRELVVSTVATQIFVLPFLIYKMGLVSVFGLFANILILPVIPIIMLLGFLVGIFGYISFLLVTPVAFVCSLLLTYILKVIYVFSHLPFASFNIKNFPLILMVIIYSIFFVIIYFHNKANNNEAH